MLKRRWILWVLVIAFIWLVVSRFTEVEKLAQILAKGHWEWVLAAAASQAMYYLVFTGSYWSAFDTVEVKSRWLNLVPVTLSALFVNVVTPTGGTGGAALFVDDARRRGELPARAAAGTLLQLVSDFGSFTLILLIGLIYLFIQHDLQMYEIIAAVLLFLMIIGLTGVLVIGLWRPALMQRLLVWLQRLVNGVAVRLKRTNFLDETWAEHNTSEFSNAAVAISQHPLRLARTLLIALAAHLLDLLCLWILFNAFGQPIKAGALVAGYAMGILFWIVSITPQGVGVVEGVMALVYTSLHIPAEVATTVSLAFRGLTFWLPFFIGFLLLNRVKAFKPSERLLSRTWGVKIISILTGLMGVVNLISAVTPSLANRIAILERLSPLEVRQGGHLTAALAGFALLLLASGLWRRKRVAWLLTLVVLVISIISHLVKGLDYEEALLALALAVGLGIMVNDFHGRSDMPSVRQGLGVLLSALLFTLAYGVTGLYLLDWHFSVNFGFWAALRQTMVMFTEFYDPGLEPVTGFGRYFANSIYMVGAITGGYAALQLLRPVFLRTPVTQIEREKARQIVEAFGHSSLARLTLMDDKSYFFNAGGTVISYVVKGRVALVLGDPIGPESDLLACLASFRGYCRSNDWFPAYYQVLPEYVTQYRSAGYQLICIGHEGIVDLNQFTLAGNVNKGLRSAYNRLDKLNYQAEILDPPISAEILHTLRDISDDWLSAMHGSEKRFSLGWFDNSYIGNSQVMIVRNPDGFLVAFANMIPEYQANEITIDLMRHLRETEHGLMDFLFVSMFEWSKAQGYTSFNLGLSSLAGIGEKPGDPAIERALHFIYEHVNQFYNFKGLHNFKEKFHPAWSPRYLVYSSAVDLPKIALAIAQADAGTNNLVHQYFTKR
jgi:phosphatidylglycerol lysyltransferase